ncbi:MAG: glycoside hydrolase family 16 protein, partial [Bacteroidota bacterium]|nr:glycoside hydrolase family 16 protein [Bacteroidota bacterium]
MKKTIILLSLISLIYIGEAQTPANDPHWQLVWEDNFDSLNTDIWWVRDNFDHYSGDRELGEGEPQLYRTDNVFIDNGNLIIQIFDDEYCCPDSIISEDVCSRQFEYHECYDYTSGWLEGKAAHNTQYGYLEARIKLPSGVGFWPAFWTGIGRGETGNAAEIDIFEMTGNRSDVMGTNIHLAYCATEGVDCETLYQIKCKDA